MSAVVCGKRSFFEDLTSSPPSSSPGSKRLRCSSTSPVRFSAPTLVDRLRALFPYMDNLLLEKVLDECDNDLDAAIKRLHDLSLGYGQVNSGPPEEPNADVEKAVANGEAAPSTNHPSQQNPEMGGAEWVELFVREITSATNIDDARSRATKVLESLEQSISVRAGVAAVQTYHKENTMLKEQIELLLRENSVLKRAVAIQHERQKEYDDKNQEVQHLRQLIHQYQEQMRTLEVNNYALTMHLRQAQQGTSMPGQYNPDVF